MAERDTSRGNGLVVLILAFLGVLGFRASTTTDPGGSERSKAAANSSQPYGTAADADSVADLHSPSRARPFWQPVIDFRGRRQPESVPNSNAAKIALGPITPDPGLSPDRPVFGEPDVAGWKSHFLIACVPHPNDSGCGDRFDSLIDSMQRAVETGEYVLDRYFYPWKRNEDRKSKKNDNVESKNVGEPRQNQASATEEPRPRDDQPGMLLFRSPMDTEKSPAAPVLLQVLLVTETSTAGINKEAFTNAVNYISRSSYRTQSNVLVLGPYFSGSSISLAQAIRDLPAFADFSPSFRLISGSATGLTQKDFDGKCGASNVRFCATVVPERIIVWALLRYLDLVRLDGDESPRNTDSYAAFVESNTSFSRLIEMFQRWKPNSNDSDEREHRRPVIFPFPSHISDLRAEYDRTSGPASNNMLRLPTLGGKLRLPAEPRNQKETEPSLDAATTAVLTERSVSGILDLIERERFRYIFIVATDAKDKLFLATLIRQRSPACRFVFSNADGMFTHPDFSPILRGSIVGSTYPLFPRNQHWSFPFCRCGREFVFPSPREYGYFNATIGLLSEAKIPCFSLKQQFPRGWRDSLLEYGPPFPQIESPEIRFSLPPVWISIVGEDSLYPVTARQPTKKDLELILPDNGESNSNRSPKPDYDNFLLELPGCESSANSGDASLGGKLTPTRNGLWYTPLMVLALLLVYQSVAYARAGRTVASARSDSDKEQTKGSRRLSDLLLPRTDTLRYDQFLYSAILLSTTFFVAAYIAFIALIPIYYWFDLADSKIPVIHVHHNEWVAPVTVSCSLFVFVVLTPVGIYRLYKGRPNVPPAANKSLQVNLMLLTLVLAITWLFYWFTNAPAHRAPSKVDLLLFSERAANLASGVSPALPVLLCGLAFTFWSVVHLRRVRDIDNWEDSSPLVVKSATPPAEESAQITEESWWRRVLIDVGLAEEKADDSPKALPWYRRLKKCCEQAKSDVRITETVLTGRWSVVIWIVVSASVFRIALHFTPAVDGVATESALLLALDAIVLLIVATWIRLRKLWGSTRELLHVLALSPFRAGFSRIPGVVMRSFGPYLSKARSDRDQLAYRDELFRLLGVQFQGIASATGTAKSISKEIAACKPLLQRELRCDQPDDKLHTPVKLSKAAAACRLVLEKAHADPRLAQRPEKLEDPGIKTDGKDAGAAPAVAADPELAAVRSWLARAETFVAMETVVYLSQFFVQLRTLAAFLSVAPVILLLAITSYSFQPQRLWLFLAIAIIGVATATVIRMIFFVERDELMSWLQNTTPNRLDYHVDFLSQVALFATPLLGIVLGMSTDLTNMARVWIEPVLQMFK